MLVRGYIATYRLKMHHHAQGGPITGIPIKRAFNVRCFNNGLFQLKLKLGRRHSGSASLARSLLPAGADWEKDFKAAI